MIQVNKNMILTLRMGMWLRLLRVRMSGSSEFEEAEVLEEIEEESDHFEGLGLFPDMKAIPQVSTPTFSDIFGDGNGEEEDMFISSSDVEIIEPPPPEIIDISSDNTVVVNIVDVSSREGSTWIPMPAWSPLITLTPEFDDTSFGGGNVMSQMSKPYDEYYYEPMPTEREPHQVNPPTEETSMK